MPPYGKETAHRLRHDIDPPVDVALDQPVEVTGGRHVIARRIAAEPWPIEQHRLARMRHPLGNRLPEAALTAGARQV